MSTKFKISSDFRGELILPTLEHKILTSDSIVHLNNEQLKNPHIRMAIRTGTLILDDPVKEIEKMVEDVENVEEVEVAVEPVVKKKRGRKKKVVNEAVIEKATEFKSKAVEPKVVETEEIEISIDLDESLPTEPKTNMSSWNPENGEMINKEDSMKKVMSDLNGIDMNVQTSSKDDTVDFEEKLNKTANDLTSSSKKKVPIMNKTATKKLGKSKKLKPIGKKRDLFGLENESLSNEESLVKEDDILFVDAEQDRERAALRSQR